MPKKIPKDLARQVKQLGEGVVEEAKEAPKEIAGRAMEQLGMKSTSQPKRPEELRPAEAEVKEKAKTRKLTQVRQELEGEIEGRRQVREEQLRQRREVVEQTQQAEGAKTKKLEVPKGPKRGFWGRRIKAAQDRAKAELGKRTSG